MECFAVFSKHVKIKQRMNLHPFNRPVFFTSIEEAYHQQKKSGGKLVRLRLEDNTLVDYLRDPENNLSATLMEVIPVKNAAPRK